MPDGNDVPLVDHHCHGVVPLDLEAERFEDLLSEAFAPAPAGTSHWDKPVALAIRRWCAPVLDLPRFCAPTDYVARRQALGAEEVNRRFLTGSGIGTYLVDTGNRPEALCGFAALGALAGAPAREILRNNEIIRDIISTHTGQDVGRVQEDFDRDFYLDAEAARDYGFVDELLEQQQGAAPSARAEA